MHYTDVPEALPKAVNAVLLLADGEVFFGSGVGYRSKTFGEICFNTAMTGYQEVLTDPSYAGQIITFTFPHVGNVGTNTEDYEAEVPHCKGLVIREPISSPSNFRSQLHLDDWLKDHHITGICGVDTRALTRHIRVNGAQNVAIHFVEDGQSFDLEALAKELADVPSLEGLELAQSVTTSSKYEWTTTRWELESGYGQLSDAEYHVVAIDYGEKRNILRCLASVGCKVTVVPATASEKDILDLKPDGVFLSNGPGDPAATAEYAVPVLKALLEKHIPVFGICLGHQLLSLALGAKTEKMHQGHRGANQPVKRLADNAVEITSQNHGFMVSGGSLPANVELTHSSLFDGVVEGICATDLPAFSVQYHPEASPGPHDSFYLFDDFVAMMKNHKAKLGGVGK